MEPYETRQELLEAAKIHGPYVQNIHNGDYYLVTRIYLPDIDNKSDFRIILDSNQYNPVSPSELFLHYIWQDGCSCEKSIEV